MTAVDAYAGYLRFAAGLEPETAIQDRSATVTARHATAVLTVTFEATPGKLDWALAGIRLTCGRATATYHKGGLAKAVAALLGPPSAAAPADAAPSGADAPASTAAEGRTA